MMTESEHFSLSSSSVSPLSFPDDDVSLLEDDEDTLKAANIGKKYYEISTEMERLATDVVREKHLDLCGARVKYVLVSPEITPTTIARCTQASDLLNLFGDCDYVITFSGDVYTAVSDRIRKIVLHHELLHIYPVQHPKTKQWMYRLRKHDVNDFSDIIEEYGLGWQNELRAEIMVAMGTDDPDDVSGLTF